jgi:hypothetical protein
MMRTLFDLVYFIVGILVVGFVSVFMAFWILAIVLVEGLFLKLTKWSKKYEHLGKKW